MSDVLRPPPPVAAPGAPQIPPAVETAPPAGARPAAWRLAMAVAGILLIAAVIAVGMRFSRTPPIAGIVASGTIEATESDLAPKVQGRLIELRVHDGDRVEKGRVLATLEGLDPALNVSQARGALGAAAAQLDAARAAYALQHATYASTLASAQADVGIARSRAGQAGENLTMATGASALDLAQAQAQLKAAVAAYARTQVDVRRTRTLVATGDAARQQLDDATAADAAAAAQLAADNDAVELARVNQANVHVRRLDVATTALQRAQSQAALTTAEAQRQLVVQRLTQVRAAQAQVEQARAALALALDQVRETELRAPFAGYIISHDVEVGELVQPGSAVLTIGDLDHPYLYVYVSESDLPRVKMGARADVTVDGLPGRTFGGTVTEISNTAQFTPENVQTKDQRIEYLVFRVKVQFTDLTGSLKPGLPADAVIRT